MDNLFSGLFGPSSQDILTQQQDQLNTSLAGMSNPFERLGMLLGTAATARPKQSTSYQEAVQREQQLQEAGSDPVARANFLRQAVADGRIPADQLVNAKRAIDLLDPTKGEGTVSASDLNSLYSNFTSESVKKYLESNDANDLSKLTNKKVARAVAKDDADWSAYEGSIKGLGGEEFFGDLLAQYGERKVTDVGEDNRLDAAKADVYNLANTLAVNAETPLTRSEALKQAKEQIIGGLRSNEANDPFAGATLGNRPTASSDSSPTVVATENPDVQSFALEDTGGELVGEDMPESQASLKTREENLTKELESATTRGAKANIRRELADVRSQIKEPTKPNKSNGSMTRKSRSNLDPDKKGTEVKKTRAKQAASIQKDIDKINKKIKFNQEVLNKRPNNKRAADALKSLKKDLERNKKTLKSIKSK